VTTQTLAEQKLANIIVDALNLEDIKPEDIAPEEQLFGDGLGLDSIDALEIALAISQKYDVQMRAEEENTREAFTSLRNLCEFIKNNE